MGACAGAGLNYDRYSSEFIKELPLLKLTDKNYITFLDSKNIFKDKDVLLRELLKNKNPIFFDENQRFLENLNNLPVHIVCIALLFLTQATFTTIPTSYLLLLEKIKNKHFEYIQRKQEDLSKSDYEVLKEVLVCYCRIVSYDVVSSTLQVEKAKREANILNKELVDKYGKNVYDSLRRLMLVYHSEVVERYVVNVLLANFNASHSINHEELFKKVFDYLNHDIVRQKLRDIFDEFYSISFNERTGEYVLNGLKTKNVVAIEKVNTIYKNPNTAAENEFTLVSSARPVVVEAPTYVAPVEIIREIEPIRIVEEKLNGGAAQASKYFSRRESKIPESVTIPKTVNSYVSNAINPTYNSSTTLNPSYSSSSSTVNFSIENRSYTNTYSTGNSYYNPDTYSSSAATLVSNSRPTEKTQLTYSKPLSSQTNYSYSSSTNNAPVNFDSSKFNSQQFKTFFLNYHNNVRRNHQADPLEEDASLSLYAQNHANFLAKMDQIFPSGRKSAEKILGENIAKVTGTSNEAVESVLKEWYEKKNVYDFQYPRYNAQASNLTQMIWKETKQIGMGVTLSDSGNAYVVVNYYPEGNTLQGFALNVKPAL